MKIPSFTNYLNESDTSKTNVKESEELDTEIDKDIAELKSKILGLQDMIADSETHEEDFIEYIGDKIAGLKDELADLLGEDEDVETFLNENYNAGEMVEILLLIKQGDMKAVFTEIKNKKNVLFTDVAKLLVERQKPEYLLRLIEMATAQGYLKI
jgi:hypothetical protein